MVIYFGTVRDVTKKETLMDYVRRVMDEKGLKPGDVQRNSRGKISDSYVNTILTEPKNLSVEKLKALALGLGVPEDDVFDVARGYSRPIDDERFRESLLFMLYEKLKTASPEKQKLIVELIRIALREADEDKSKRKS